MEGDLVAGSHEAPPGRVLRAGPGGFVGAGTGRSAIWREKRGGARSREEVEAPAAVGLGDSATGKGDEEVARQ